jgi:hypothetical protein
VRNAVEGRDRGDVALLNHRSPSVDLATSLKHRLTIGIATYRDFLANAQRVSVVEGNRLDTVKVLYGLSLKLDKPYVEVLVVSGKC